MALIKWTPFLEPFGEMDKWWEEMGGKNAFTPAIDIYEKGSDLIAKMPIAEIDPKDVEVTVKNGVLTIKGKTEKKSEVEEKNYYRKEIKAGSFYRTVALPVAVMEDKVKAEYSDGALAVIMPKAREEKAKRIEVRKK